MKALRVSLLLLCAALLALLILVGAAWVWSDHSRSLATSLEQLARYLPSDQTLQVKDVKGSLRSGGSIGWLRWQRGALSVEARDLRVGWTLRPLLGGELQLAHLAVAHLRIDDQRAPVAPTAPTGLRLPLKVAASFSVDTLEWVGPPALWATGLTGHYAFDGKDHHFDADNVHVAAGNYRISARLQATAPMALSLQVQGSVQTKLPSSQQTVTVQAQATLQGPLAGPDATLELQARLVPELASALTQALQASVSARLQPWQAQPLTQAKAHWQALDLAALWPQAPQTQLAGEANITPAGAGWQAAVKLTNARSGPWNQQRLPLDSLNAKLIYVDGKWAIESLLALGGGGRIEGKGQVTSAATSIASWQGRVSVFGVNLAALDSRLGAAALDGQFSAQQAPKGIAFEAQLQPSQRQPRSAKAAAGLRLRTVHVKGLWLAPLLTLDTLAVQTDDAQLAGNLNLHTDTRAAAGRLALTLPGATALLDGQIASTDGKGEFKLHLSDAALAAHWLGRWPQAPAALANASIRGAGDFSGRWTGGWKNQAQDLQIQASLSAPRLDLGGAAPTAPGWRLLDLRADLGGTLRALQLSLRGQAEYASQHVTLQAQAHGGRRSDGAWKASLDSAQLGAQDSLQPGAWTLQLSQALTIDWQQSAGARTLEISAGSGSLIGPVPGAATVSWQAARWSQQTSGLQPRTEWHTQGRLQGLPLGWLELLGRTQMANLGLRGDLLFGGEWDAKGGEALQLRATLQRTGGDLQLLTDDANAGPLSAGVREAQLLLTADGEQLTAKLRWDSERAGQAQADFSTRLQYANGSWRWPMEAPLAGTLRTQLPPVGAWSLLAPPGWRLRGTLDADASLSGTRGAPLWRGSLQARDLAVRSVADGIDFSNGALRATLDGQRLNIVELRLQGAGGAGGQLSGSGSVLWAPPTEPASNALSRLRMELDLQAQGLRVSARADRRLVVSGKLETRLADARLTVRGTLKADQALFILAQDTAPQLGDDVVVRASGNSATRSMAAPTDASARAAAGVRVTPDVAITLDLGPDFQLRGRGLNTRLAGTLELRSTPERALVPRLSGELRTVGGTYLAYGQQLDIEEGVLRFAGPYDNPALNILAIRPNLVQRVGVQISGTALSPVVRLYAEPDLPDAEKLAWLVLGRTAANGGAETAMLQQAALALLGGNGRGLSGGMAQALGLDELSVRGSTSNAAGTSTTGAAVTLGKRVSRNFHVAYERSLAGTMGTFYIFYDLSRRFTLRAQTGEQSAMDLIFTLRYD
jgi:translocation and assembly module TamB